MNLQGSIDELRAARERVYGLLDEELTLCEEVRKGLMENIDARPDFETCSFDEERNTLWTQYKSAKESELIARERLYNVPYCKPCEGTGNVVVDDYFYRTNPRDGTCRVCEGSGIPPKRKVDSNDNTIYGSK